MDINELESFKLSDAVKFNKTLNPRLWGRDEHLLPEVREKLMAIADDFREFLGVDGLDVKDVTVSGSNAAYTYTPHSDIDLHLVVNTPSGKNSDVYKELFDAKKYQYNDQHNYKIGGYDVELYVQDADQVHHSQGIYSVLNNDWVSVPRRRRPEVDDMSVRSKFEDIGHRIEQAIASGDPAQLEAIAAKVKHMRQAGLDSTGEFGPENLAFKALRTQGLLDQLSTARSAVKDQELSLQERKKKRSQRGYGGYWYPGFSFGDSEGGGDGGGGESVRENTKSPDIKQVLQPFIDSCVEYLGIEQAPKIILKRDPEWTRRNGTFGQFDPDTYSVTLAVSGRHVLDILRTLAHELTHARQDEQADMPVDAGETGSPYEDEANAMAGRIMRHWVDQYPEFFKDIPLEESVKGKLAATAAAACIAGTPGCATTGADAIRTVQDVGRTAQAMKGYGASDARAEVLQHIKNDLRRRQGQVVPEEVNESLDQPYKILRWEKSDYGDVDAIARLDDGTFLSIMFNKGFKQETKEEAWSVEFFRNNSQEKTGEGDQQRVFATVLSAIQTFISDRVPGAKGKYKPNKIYFSASKEVNPDEDQRKAMTRARLYDSLVQRYARALGFRAFRAETGNKVMYELSRIKPVAEDISRRGFLQGAGAAALGAAGVAQAGQFKSRAELDKDPESVEKIWKPRIAELESRCNNILDSFKAVASSVNPEWAPILNQVKVVITLGDSVARFGRAQGQTQTSTYTPTASRTTDWEDVKRKNPNSYTVELWSKIYPNISYDGPITGAPAPTIAIQIRPDGAIINTKLLAPSGENEWDQAVLDGISKTKIIPPPKAQADKKLSNPHTIKINFPLGWWSFTNKPTGPAVTTNKSTYKILLDVTVFWDAPDSTLAWILGHEVGHLVNFHPADVPLARRREYELEADEVGAVLAQKLGYNRANFFKWLYNDKAENLKIIGDRTHPEPIDRVNNLKQKTGFELAAVKYIDSMVQQLQSGLAEGSVKQGIQEATGYIPVNDKEARDPRYSMAITQDIKPGEVQRQARKMGWTTDAAGRPPLLTSNASNLRETQDSNMKIANILNETTLGGFPVKVLHIQDQGVEEAGNANSGRRGPNHYSPPDSSPVTLGRVEKTAGGVRHHADPSRYGGYDPKPEDDRLLGPQSRWRLDRAVRGLNEFAPLGSGDGREPDEEAILRRLAAQWWLGTEQEMAKAQKTLAAMGWDIGQDESGDDDAGVFVIRAGDENGDSYIAFNHSELEELNEAYNNYHANRTGFRTGARDPEGQDPQASQQVWGLKINGKVWSKQGKDVTFTSKQAAINTMNAILKNRPDLQGKIGLVTRGGVAEGLNEFAPGAGGDDGDADPYRYPKPEQFNRSVDFFGQFEAGHFDREDFDDTTGVFKGYWGNTQIAYFKFDNPAKTGSDDPGMGWYYEPESDSPGNSTSASTTVDNSEERKKQELNMINAFLKSGQQPKPGSQIYQLMKRNGLAEGSVAKKPQPYNEPGWAKKLSKDQLDAIAGPRYNKDKKVSEGEGRFAGDTPVNIGGATVKRMAIGDTVTYFGRRAKIVDMTTDRKMSRITIANDMGGITKDVLTSDLKRTGVAEAIKLNAPQRTIPRDELQGYADRIKTGTKTKRDKFSPIIHGSNIKAITKDDENTEWDLDDLSRQITTRPKAILGTNAKMEKSKTEGEIIYDLTLPALSGIVVDEDTGDFVEITTCPGAGQCQLFCYARKGGYVMFPASSMSAAQALNFLVNDPEGYSARVNQEIKAVKSRADKAGIQLVVRWHDAGDFFSKEYLDLAYDVAKSNPDVQFYAYTKMGDVATGATPANFTMNFSSGSKRGEEKKVEFYKQQNPGATVKQGVTVPKDMFFDLIARKGNSLIKDAKGRTQFASPEALNTFKQRLAQQYKVAPDSIITYDQMLATPVGPTPKWNVIVQPGAGDRAANRKDVIDSYLMFH